MSVLLTLLCCDVLKIVNERPMVVVDIRLVNLVTNVAHGVIVSLLTPIPIGSVTIRVQWIDYTMVDIVLNERVKFVLDDVIQIVMVMEI